MIIAIITGVITLSYLIFQSVWDIKCMQTFTLPNNAAVLISIGLYLFDCIRVHELSVHTMLPIVIAIAVIVILCKANLYGTGDKKAMIVILLMQRYWSESYPHPDMFIFLLSMWIADAFFILCNTKYLKVGPLKEKQRKAFFPFLTVGYIAGIVLDIFLI